MNDSFINNIYCNYTQLSCTLPTTSDTLPYWEKKEKKKSWQVKSETTKSGCFVNLDSLKMEESIRIIFIGILKLSDTYWVKCLLWYHVIAICFACLSLMATIWLYIFCPICFQEPANKPCQNERSLLPKGCPEKHHQSVPKWAVRRHAPSQQLDTRCKGQPWLVKVLILPTEAYWTRNGSYSDFP